MQQLGEGDDVKDFAHASKTFVDGRNRLHPKHSFSYHVFFEPTGVAKIGNDSFIEAGMMVKELDFPKYQIDTKTYNAYNRKNIVQSKINYQPITLTFHDDMADVVRELWYDYYQYYYQDSKMAETIYSAPYKYGPQAPNPYGFSSEVITPYFKNIRLYQLHQKRFSECVLINPIITEWTHGRQDNSSSAPVESSMTLIFETVKYNKGIISGNSVSGFGDLHYDKSPSPLTPAGGGTTSIAGPGGLIDSLGSISEDLASGDFLSAGLTALRSAKNFKGSDLKNIAKSELKTGVKDILRGKNPAERFYVPTPKQNTSAAPSATQYPPP